MLLPPHRRVRDQEEEEYEEEEDGENRRSNRPAQASVLYQDLLMSDGEDDASEEEGDNPFSGKSTRRGSVTAAVQCVVCDLKVLVMNNEFSQQ